MFSIDEEIPVQTNGGHRGPPSSDAVESVRLHACLAPSPRRHGHEAGAEQEQRGGFGNRRSAAVRVEPKRTNGALEVHAEIVERRGAVGESSTGQGDTEAIERAWGEAEGNNSAVTVQADGDGLHADLNRSKTRDRLHVEVVEKRQRRQQGRRTRLWSPRNRLHSGSC